MSAAVDRSVVSACLFVLLALGLTGCARTPGQIVPFGAEVAEMPPAATSAATSATSASQPVGVPVEVLAAYEPLTFIAPGGRMLNFRLLRPEDPAPGEKFPLVIVLHGSGERGDDNARQLMHGAKEFIGHTRRHPAYVVFPQCPKDVWWDGPHSRVRPPAPGTAVGPKLPVPMPTLVQLVKALPREYPIDLSRIYVMGLSMGGYGTFELVNQMPDTFAAAVPMCGGGDVDEARRYKSTPFWVCHGGVDNIVVPEQSRMMVRAMRREGVWVRYTEYLNGNHNAWTPTFNDRDLIEWMFAQRRR